MSLQLLVRVLVVWSSELEVIFSITPRSFRNYAPRSDSIPFYAYESNASSLSSSPERAYPKCILLNIIQGGHFRKRTIVLIYIDSVKRHVGYCEISAAFIQEERGRDKTEHRMM